MRPVTASMLLRIGKCPASHVLPHVYSNSKPADRGTQVHAYLAAIASGVDRERALEAHADETGWCARIDVDMIPRGDAEASFTWDSATGRAKRCQRPYPVTDGAIGGTADLVVLNTDRPMVIDWKTTAYEVDLEAAREQLNFYALCIAIITGAPEIDCKVVVIKENGIAGEVSWVSDLDTRVATAAKLRGIVAAVTRATGNSSHPDVTTGSHCRYCPAMLYCPATRAAEATLKADSIGAAYAASKRLEKAAELIKERVANAVDAGERIGTGDGRIVRRIGRQLKIVEG